MRSLRLAPLCLFLSVPVLAAPAAARAQQVADAPDVLLFGVPFQITVEGGPEGDLPWEIRAPSGEVLASGIVEDHESATASGLVVSSRSELPLTVIIGPESLELSPRLVPGWLSLVPPLIAIALALIFREVVTALFAGAWLGALMIAGFNPVTATWRLIDQFAIPEIANMEDGHAQIIVFSLLLAGMVGIISRSGGSRGIVEAVRPFARTARRGQIATWLAGMGIFFDDYANTLIVGNTMRPLTDKLRISREKLAYLVDATAAPLAAIVPISTWVGYEISLIADGLGIAADQSPAEAAALGTLNPFRVFLETIPYRFYPVLALYFAGLVAFSRRDFGPMALAERRARQTGQLYREGAQLLTDTSGHAIEPKEGKPHRWWNAALPILTVVLVVLAGLYVTGSAGAGPGASLSEIFGESDAFITMAWGSLAGCIAAIALAVSQRILTLEESINAWLSGMRGMLIAIVILVLAWSLGSVTAEIGTSAYLSEILSDRVALNLVPVIVFATAAGISFATGTSWGTMAILMPLVVPLTVALGGFAAGTDEHYTILLGAISSVLAGAIFGDHCSPISDTTVLSSAASGCDHVDHVRTQMPYALIVAAVGMLVGDIATAYGLNVWIAIALGMILLYGFLRVRGTLIEDPPEAQEG
jgi:Na+/H+ antiporter NhaC